MSKSKTSKKSIINKLLLWILVVFVIGLLSFIGYFMYSYFNSLPADSSALQSSIENASIKFSDKGGYYAIQPLQASRTGLIIYPGAFVDPKAYIASYYSLAKGGINVFIIKSPLNFALLNTGQANQTIADNTDVSSWFVAGHSLGGVAACDFAKNNEDSIDGLILLGSYCNGNASTLGIPVLSISASNDGLSTTTKINDSRQALPKNTQFVVISGANHTQFGTFSKTQPGDNQSTISQLEAQTQITKQITEFINKNSD